MAGFNIGDMITFNYMQGTVVHDQFPQVLVLHNNWLCYTRQGMSGVKTLRADDEAGRRCVHGLNWNNLDAEDKRYLLAVMNPRYEMEMARKNKDFARQMETVHALNNLDIQSPEDFYVRLIRPFIKPKKWEPYRRYRLDKMRGVRVFQSAELLSGAKSDTLWRRAFRRLQALRGPR